MRVLVLAALLTSLPLGYGRAVPATECPESACPGLDWGGSVRLRGEGWNDFAFSPEEDDTFVLGRLLLHADTRFNERVRLYVQGKSALSTDRDLPGGARTLDVDTLALQQAFLDLRFGQASSSVAVMVGRQALNYGRQRLVSPLPWGNSLRAWDGAKLRIESTRWNLDAFYTWYVPVDKYDRNRRDSDQPFYGVHATLGKPGAPGLDVYWLHRDRADARFNAKTGPEQRDTIGLRVFKQGGAWRGDLELAVQTGTLGPYDIDAGMASLEIARHWDRGIVASAAIGLDYASGDRGTADRVETFDHLYPLGHAYFGYIDIIGRQNIVSAFLRGRFRLSPATILEITGLTFSRARSEDGLYNGGGAMLRPGDASGDRRVGEELDMTLSWPLASAGKLLIGYSHFFPGKFVETSGPSAATDFGYVQYLFTF